ncbi:MAG: hypothetical protein DI565_19535 [Ancylobacter novellus]|uniref:Polysaccharide pyruvyl transferase domain-containing protein n=1 Tax=Ancylobacter novellus TaxID=921 RepID=A0A2W5M0B9_ANCNO|nr:MAG: hypothetical protein DI565_19535 [Ancylobacter novellus]
MGGSLRTVHMASLADIDNFGDALFPLLAQRRLGPAGYRVEALSPTGRACRWSDAPRSTSIAELVETAPSSAGMLIGGGNLAIGAPASRYECLAVEFWLTATWFAVVHDLPIVWNAPGAPRPFPARGLGLLARAAMETADHLAIRDRLSRDFLSPATGREIAVHPDTAIDVSSMWPKTTLAAAFARLLERKNVAGSERAFLTVHVRDLSAEALDRLAFLLDEIATRDGMIALLLAIGPGAGDDAAVRRLARGGRFGVLVDDPESLAEIAAALAFSSAYVGQSLHGAIVAASYGVPGILVQAPPARRFRGFQEYRGLPEAVTPDFADALAQLAKLPRHAPPPAKMFEDLEAHWEAARAALGRAPRETAARLAFLRTVGRLGAAHLGADWAARPMRLSSYVSKRRADAD